MSKFLALLAVIASIPIVYAKTYDGYTLFHVYPNTQSKVDYLRALDKLLSPDLDIQIWVQGSTKLPFHILVGPQSKELFINNLKRKKVRYVEQAQNLEEPIEKEKEPVSFFSHEYDGLTNADKFTRYLELNEINAFIHDLAKTYPNIVQVQELGLSYENRSIYVVKVGSDNGKKKPIIWIDGGIHAREWLSISTVSYMMNKLITGYSTDPNMKNFVDKADWYFVPVLNVDGYEYTHTDDRFWRRNRRPAPCKDTVRCCNGVDLNRNFDHSFGGAGSSDKSCADDYHGTAPFSEPETRAVRDFVLKNAKDMKAFITIHTYGQMWFYPYGNQTNTYPEDVKELAALSEKAVDAIRALSGTVMMVGTPADILYPSSGGSMDWVKAAAGVKYCFGMELRPGIRNSIASGFVVPPSNIVPTGEEIWAGISVVADEVIQKFAS